MARNSRFRSTSGPSSNRSRPEKGKFPKSTGGKRSSFSKGGRPGDDKPSFKKEGRSGEDKPFFRKSGRTDGDKPPYGKKPFQKGSWHEKRADASKDSPGDFARKRIAKFPPTDSFSGEGKPREKRSYSKPDGDRRDGGGKRDFEPRAPRSFSKGDLKRRPAASDDKGDFKPKAPFPQKRDRSFSSDKPYRGDSDRKKPSRDVRGDGKRKEGDEKRKSFVESKRDYQIKVADETVREESKAPSGDELIRLNKYISNSGVCSRREADNLITMGLITVNGKSITELGYKVKATDDVRYEGRRLKSEKPVYILLNKPKGYITTTDDPQERNTVMKLVENACKERVYPVGRLDRNTSGLLLLTNDGDLTDKLTHPSYNVKKIYKAELDKPLTKADFQKVIDGVRLEEGKATVDDLAIVSEDGKTVGLEIHIGWNRVIRRIFEALGYEVVKLDRTVYATLDKKDLPRGHWRFLRQDEVVRLKHFQ